MYIVSYISPSGFQISVWTQVRDLEPYSEERRVHKLEESMRTKHPLKGEYRYRLLRVLGYLPPVKIVDELVEYLEHGIWP